MEEKPITEPKAEPGASGIGKLSDHDKQVILADLQRLGIAPKPKRDLKILDEPREKNEDAPKG